jgi:leucyl/phenylalanyl-tRNA--protein transferase
MTLLEKDATEIEGRARATTEPKSRFRETVAQWLRRWSLGTLYALRPRRINLVPRVLLLSLAHLLAPEAERDKLPEHPVYYGKRGLVGISNDLSLQAVLDNYRRGYYPIRHVGAMKWWSPEERAVIDPAL